MKNLKNIIESIPSSILAIGGGLLIIFIVSLSLFNKQDDTEKSEINTEEESSQEVTVSKGETEETASTEEETASTEPVEEVNENLRVTNTQRKTIESTVKNFSKNFLNLDSSEPDESVKGSKPYMTENLYDEQKNFRYEGNWDTYKIKHKDIEIDVLPEVQEEVYKVAVESEGQAYDKDNNKTKKQNEVLLLDVVKQGNSYLIDKISYEANE